MHVVFGGRGPGVVAALDPRLPSVTPTGVGRAGGEQLACETARVWYRAVATNLPVCRSRGRNKFGFVEVLCRDLGVKHSEPSPTPRTLCPW